MKCQGALQCALSASQNKNKTFPSSRQNISLLLQPIGLSRKPRKDLHHTWKKISKTTATKTLSLLIRRIFPLILAISRRFLPLCIVFRAVIFSVFFYIAGFPKWVFQMKINLVPGGAQAVIHFAKLFARFAIFRVKCFH